MVIVKAENGGLLMMLDPEEPIRHILYRRLTRPNSSPSLSSSPVDVAVVNHDKALLVDHPPMICNGYEPDSGLVSLKISC
ncbi:hypothetical protein V6N12_035807 [Hibiscus sabdariffa]|uniref:Uncharacterized protein n=1 Tax=Hibiscus sabdariffa TaxID=183260 RepID=A0ABR2ENU6_9ROSI